MQLISCVLCLLFQKRQSKTWTEINFSDSVRYFFDLYEKYSIVNF